MGPNLFINYGEAIAMLLFGIGFGNLLLQGNMIKKIIGLNIMDTAIYLFLAEKGSRQVPAQRPRFPLLPPKYALIRQPPDILIQSAP